MATNLLLHGFQVLLWLASNQNGKQSFEKGILWTKMKFYSGYPPNQIKVLHMMTSKPIWDFIKTNLEPRWDFTWSNLESTELLHQAELRNQDEIL